jgi:hypothetical protein
MAEVLLPIPSGGTETYVPGTPQVFAPKGDDPLPRIAFAAAHVVADPLADIDPWLDVAIDWEATLDYRRYLWELGLGVAEAMDTAQRGMGLDWAASLELIERSAEAARDFDGDALLACGAGTDHVAPDPSRSVEDVIGAYEEQCSAVEAAGGRIILMASRHWLGEMFDPALTGYWGHDDHVAAAKVDGIKISLLDDKKEIALRRRLPEGVRMYTGDDFNYVELIAGDERGHSDALLGIFDVIAPAASAALAAMGRGDMAAYFNILEPTVPLSRHIFKPQTRFYKTGVVFMAYLNGLQDHFAMVGGQQSARSALHLAELFRPTGSGSDGHGRRAGTDFAEHGHR